MAEAYYELTLENWVNIVGLTCDGFDGVSARVLIDTYTAPFERDGSPLPRLWNACEYQAPPTRMRKSA